VSLRFSPHNFRNPARISKHDSSSPVLSGVHRLGPAFLAELIPVISDIGRQFQLGVESPGAIAATGASKRNPGVVHLGIHTPITQQALDILGDKAVLA
jgi:hypothetical protein